VILILTVAAFFYALGLVLSGRKLPEPAQARGLRRRFILATLLFVGLLGFACEKEKENSVEISNIGKRRWNWGSRWGRGVFCLTGITRAGSVTLGRKT